MTTVLLLVLAAVAQDDTPDPPLVIEANVDVGCGRALGFAAGITPGSRDWDFTTPGPYALSGSPVFSQTCMRTGRDPRHGAAWIGVDAIPWYQHSYARLNDRAPLLVLINWGIGRQIGERGTLGPELVSNGVAWGLGLRYTMAWGDRDGHSPGLDVRFHVLPGTEPDFQLVVVSRFHATDLPQDADLADARHDALPRWRGVLGFEMGTVVGLRGEILNLDNWALAVRLGENTAFRRDIGLQPIALGSVGVPFGAMRLTGSFGTTRYDGDWVPVLGAALVVAEPTDVGRLQLGILVDARGGEERYQSPDVAMGFVW